MDHARPLRHAADREAVSPNDRLLRRGVGGHDRLRRCVAAVRAEVRGGGAKARQHAVERETDADDARGDDQHLLGPEPEQPAGLRRGRERVELAPVRRSPRSQSPS